MKKLFLVVAVMVAGLSGVLVVACSDSACTTGRQTACICPDGTTGLQECSDDGSYGACQCGLGTGAGGNATTSTSSAGGTSSTSTTGGSGGTMCAAGETLCGSDCVDLNTSTQHCGACNKACPATASGCSNGVCTCPNNQKLCNDECIGVQTDAMNCGGCDHQCLGGSSCTSGFCEIETLASALGSGGSGGAGGSGSNDYVDEPYALAVDSNYVYWASAGVVTSGNRVMRKSLAGGAAEVLEYPVANPRDIVLSGNKLLWTEAGVDPLSTTNVDSVIGQVADYSQATPGAATELVSGQAAGVTGLAVSGDFIFWSNKTKGQLWKATLAAPGDAAAFKTLTAGSQPWDLAVNATHLYWTDYGSNGIGRIAIGGGNVEAVATNQGGPVGIALDSNYVYWAAETAGTINRKGTGGGAVEVIASGQDEPAFVAVDGNYVYWTNYGNGTVMRAPAAGGDTIILAAGQSEPYAIAVAGDYVYWANQSGNAIRRVAK